MLHFISPYWKLKYELRETEEKTNQKNRPMNPLFHHTTWDLKVQEGQVHKNLVGKPTWPKNVQ